MAWTPPGSAYAPQIGSNLFKSAASFLRETFPDFVDVFRELKSDLNDLNGLNGHG